MRPVWTCPSCGWRQSGEQLRICGRYGEPCPGPLSSEAPTPTDVREPKANTYKSGTSPEAKNHFLPTEKGNTP